MTKFIRLDMNGHWKGTKHQSSVQGRADECYCFDLGQDECTCNDNNFFEEGISCYVLNNQAQALELLRNYWYKISSNTIADYKNMQITVFEGERLESDGSDSEDMATCNKTIAEIPAYDIFLKIYEAREQLNWEEINEEKYEKILNGLEL